MRKGIVGPQVVELKALHQTVLFLWSFCASSALLLIGVELKISLSEKLDEDSFFVWQF